MEVPITVGMIVAGKAEEKVFENVTLSYSQYLQHFTFEGNFETLYLQLI